MEVQTLQSWGKVESLTKSCKNNSKPFDFFDFIFRVLSTGVLQIRYWQELWHFPKIRSFAQKTFPPQNSHNRFVLAFMFNNSNPFKAFKPRNLSKNLKRQREIDVMKMAWNCEKSLVTETKQFFLLILVTAIGGRPKPELCFLSGRLGYLLLPKERYGSSLSGCGSNTQHSNREAEYLPLSYCRPKKSQTVAIFSNVLNVNVPFSVRFFKNLSYNVLLLDVASVVHV